MSAPGIDLGFLSYKSGVSKKKQKKFFELEKKNRLQKKTQKKNNGSQKKTFHQGKMFAWMLRL